jgi:hypothetical protein
VRVERGAEFRQVQVGVDAAELVTGFEHPSGDQRSAMVPSRQRLTFLECSRQISIIDPMRFVERSVRARVDGTPSREAGLLTQLGSRLGPVSWDSWRVIAIFHPVRGMELAPLRGAIVPGGGRRYMGQIAGFQETLRRVAMTGEGLVEDRADSGLRSSS